MTFVPLCHEYYKICINMSQMSSTCVRVCQLTPDYMRVKYAHIKNKNFRSMPSCERQAYIGSQLNNFTQHTPWLPQSPARLADF